MSLSQLPLQCFQNTLNHYLQLDPATPERIAKLHGKTIAINLKGFPICFYLQFAGQTVVLLTERPDQIDTSLSGTPMALVSMSWQRGAKASKQLFSGDVIIEGDVELGQSIKALFDELDIDWEEHLSIFVGDVVAHQIGNIARRLKHWGVDTQKTLRLNATEFLQEELRQFPPAEEVEDFFQDVTALYVNVERLEARVARLQKFIKESQA